MLTKLSIWQRLNPSLLLLIGLLILGAVIAWGVKDFETRKRVENLTLQSEAARVRLRLYQMEDSFRGLLLDPKSQKDKELHDEARRELSDTIFKNMEREFGGDSKLQGLSMNVTRSIRDFLLWSDQNFEKPLSILQDTDPKAAMAQYPLAYQTVTGKREAVLTGLGGEVIAFTNHNLSLIMWVQLLGGGLMAAILFSSLWIGIRYSSSITEPLSQLVGALEMMRRGDFTRRIPTTRRDEFGVIGEHLNRLADDLSVLVGQVQRSGIQVNTTATEISATARQQQGTANEIAATTSQIGATSKQISATSRELVKTMSEVNDVAEETALLAAGGQNAIASMEATMRQILAASGSVSAKLAVLNEKTGNINSVVTTITKVADQTNLLSLNAAIEAEKAGEYGLGFAVVAMEIRRLADQTAVSTYDIEKMVKEMQSAVSAGVMGMDKFSEDVRRGFEEIRQVSVPLAQIIHQVQALTPRFQLVNEGMQSQATGAHQISEILIQLSESAQQTAESLRQSSLAIEQLNAAARGLQNSVSRFKLEAT